MPTGNILKSNPQRKTPKWVLPVFIVAGLAGLLDTLYLTVKFYSGGSLSCVLLEGCDIVAASKYASVWSVPISLGGAIYYFLITISAIIFLETGNRNFLKFASTLAVVGFGFSLWLLYLQIFTINALCIYCLFSLVTSGAAFSAAIAALRE